MRRLVGRLRRPLQSRSGYDAHQRHQRVASGAQGALRFLGKVAIVDRLTTPYGFQNRFAELPPHAGIQPAKLRQIFDSLRPKRRKTADHVVGHNVFHR